MMRTGRSKSINKEVSRGFEDEVKDYSCQSLRSLNLFDELIKKLMSQKPPSIEVSDGLKTKTGGPKKYIWRDCLSAEQVSLAQHYNSGKSSTFFNSEVIKEFAQGLGGDSRECYEHMYDLRYLMNQQVLSHYKGVYRELKTIPIVFLSVVKTEKKGISAIYLWQFNENCPIEVNPAAKLAVDCTLKRQVLVPHNSILLLAKFVTTDQEGLLSGQFLSDSRILIKSRLSESHIRLREYDMMDLIDLVTLNPYDARSDNNRFYCASKLDLNMNGDLIDCDLSRIRRLKEIELLEFAGVDTVSMFIKTDSQKIVLANIKDVLSDNLFSEVYSDQKSAYLVLIERSLSKAILFKSDSLKVIDLSDFGVIRSVFQGKDVLYFVNTEGNIFSIEPSGVSKKDLQVKIEVDESQKIKFLETEDCEYLVYLKGNKFYAAMLEQKGTSELLFDAEELEPKDQKSPVKFTWEIVEDKIVLMNRVYVHVYDITEQKLTKRKLLDTELLEYDWELLAEKNILFATSRYEETWRIKTVALKEEQIKECEKVFQISDIFSNYLLVNLKKTEESLYLKVTGPANKIVFMRLEEPYLTDDVHRVSNMPNYLFADFVYPAMRNVAVQYSTWQDRWKQQEEQKKKEEFQKKVEKEEEEFEEYTEMKAKVEKFKKESKMTKYPQKKDEERKEKMYELRKAIAKTGKEEGADKNDKRLKDVKEEYMGMYQDLKKEKKQQIKEKEKDKLKDRKNARNNKRDEF